MESNDSLLALLEEGRELEAFAEKILGIKLNVAQVRWFRSIQNQGAWTVAGSVHVSANQTGKSLGLAILTLWGSIYKVGVKESDPKKWLETPYHWFHVAPQQQQAYVPLRDIEMLVKGAHPAQNVGEKQYGLKCRFPAPVITFGKVEQYYDGFSTAFGAEVQFRTTDEKAKALQGRRANVISFDEAAFEDHLKTVINETLLMRLVSTNGPLLIVSTPNGLNDYYEVVESIRETGHHPSLEEDQVWITPDAWVLVWSTVADNIGYGLTVEAVERMERDLDPATKEQNLRGQFLEPQEAFFIPTSEVQRAWRDSLPNSTPAREGRQYIVFWDPSVASDPTACYVMDVTTKPWIVVHEVWERKPGGINSLLPQMFGLHAQYNAPSGALAMTGFDATSMGGAIIRQSLVGLYPQKPLDFGGAGKIKLDVLTNLRAALVRGELLIPGSMIGLKREILNYRLDDRRIVQDRVMALAGAAWLASKSFGGTIRASFSVSGRVTPSAWR